MNGHGRNGERVPSGIYFIQSTSGGITETRKISGVR